ncbi:hypothetical protein AX14_013227 [Amanita brunnescens Koide BX004]|nr:hypothetical protein AX14_013227 [Amanita brunnescens Koide BX004]
MPVRRAALGLFTLLLLVCTTRAVLVNRTIDDTNGDPTTGLRPIYLPNGPWNGVSCSNCAINPNASLAFDKTWSAATYNPGLKNMNITFSFTGVAIVIFFILANGNDLPTGITANTACNFTLDGLLVHTFFSPQPDESTPEYQYNVTGYSTEELSNENHTMVISTNDYPINVYVNFDYAIYTADEPDNTTSSTSGPSSTSASGSPSASTSGPEAAHNSSSNNLNKAGIIVGCVLGGLALVALFVILILFRRLRIKKKRPIVASFNEQPLQDLASGSAPLVPVRQSPQAPKTKDRGRDELRALRQMEIDSRLQTAQQEMHDLASRQEVQSEPGPSSSEVEREGSGPEMEAIHEQIRQLRAQISQLQMERSSNWAQGLTDEAPPPY